MPCLCDTVLPGSLYWSKNGSNGARLLPACRERTSACPCVLSRGPGVEPIRPVTMVMGVGRTPSGLTYILCSTLGRVRSQLAQNCMGSLVEIRGYHKTGQGGDPGGGHSSTSVFMTYLLGFCPMSSPESRPGFEKLL